MRNNRIKQETFGQLIAIVASLLVTVALAVAVAFFVTGAVNDLTAQFSNISQEANK